VAKLLFVALAWTVVSQDPFQDPAAGWKDFGKGSWVTMKGTTKMDFGGQKQEIATETKTTLLEKTADKLTIEVESSAMGQTQKQTQDIPLKADPNAEKPDVKTKELGKGEEEIEVNGKKIKCSWIETEFEVEQQGMTSKGVNKIWTNKDVPGHTVKLTMKLTEPMTMDVEMVVTGYEKK
jgi:hypothetical protein